MAAVIGTYDYTYGAGNELNRQIQFSRTPRNEIQARVFVLNAGVVGLNISTVPGDQITVEMESTSSKANALALGRAPNPDQVLSALTMPQQNQVIGALGNRRITVGNDVNKPGNFESVTKLTIFDPS